MKKLHLALLLLAAILVIGVFTIRPADNPLPRETAASPAGDGNDAALDPSERAEKHYMPLVESALSVLADSPRNDLSRKTYAFEPAYAYTGPSEDLIAQYGGSDAYTEPDRAYFDAVCDLVVDNMPQDASAYDKYRYLAYFVSECADYDYKGDAGIMSVTPYGAIMGGKSICLGYTYTFLYLCEKADLWCRPVEGISTKNNETHGWNLVKLEDGTYYVDVTWCDELGTPGSDGWLSYFMLTEDTLLKDHGVWSGGPATGKTIYG